MPATPATTLKRTPLHARHLAHGARMVPFGGWEMPVSYAGIAAEHLAVRAGAGLFDVSHMGEVEIAGSGALAAVQRISCNDAARLEIGQAQYSALTTPEGTFLDDLLVYRMADDHFLLVTNAANTPADFAWIRKEVAADGDTFAVNTSSRYALLALQGPRAQEILQPLTAVELADLQYYRFTTGEVAAIRVTISRTGYTGEDGFELFAPPQMADRLWMALLDAGAAAGIQAAGLGCPRHAAARSGHAAARQRHRRDDDGDRGGPRLDCRLGQAGLQRPGGAAAAETRRRRPQAGRFRDARARHRAAGLRGIC